MSNSQDSSTWTHKPEDCVSNLQFVLTNNGSYDFEQLPKMDVTGDCAVIATSIATGISNDQARHRLSLLAKSLTKHRRLISEECKMDVKDPIHGTHIQVCRLFLITHHFNPQAEHHCFCKAQAPHVLVGTTDDGSSHVAAVVNGQAFGMYDIINKQFEILEVWKSDEVKAGFLGTLMEEIFSSQRKVTSMVRRLLTSDG